eukprot:Platyproteum_vivax@DN681_c0_g1_i1.p1
MELSYQTNEKIYNAAHVMLMVLPVLFTFVILPVVVQMLLYATPLIYIGCHLSLHIHDVDSATQERKGEIMSGIDAALFPIIGSAGLFGLFVAFRYFGPEWVNYLTSLYLSVLAVFAVGESISFMVAVFLPTFIAEKHADIRFQLPWVLANKDGPYHISITGLRVVSYLIGAAVAIMWLVTDHFSFHNYLAIYFSIQALAQISLGQFKTGVILLCGLFVYDIFWVFGTTVMVSVAKNFKGPAKLLFPTSFNPPKFALLGLGDLVIPGVFISMALRFDFYSFCGTPTEPQAPKEHAVDMHAAFPKHHFTWVFAAYLMGLITTVIVMLIFKAGQPALFYIVPFCLGAMSLVCYFRGTFKAAWDFDESVLFPPLKEEVKAEEGNFLQQVWGYVLSVLGFSRETEDKAEKDKPSSKEEEIFDVDEPKKDK